jgi:RHS repeat-associated protein/uncharacterized delta-60 repeat protein
MKNLRICQITQSLVTALATAVTTAYANPDRAPDELGANHRSWSVQRERSGRHEREGGVEEPGRIVEIATGMNYWDGQQWLASIARFEAAGEGFVANQLQYMVSLNDNLNRVGSVTVVTHDGVVLHSTPVAIGLYDAASGRSTIIAGIRNSEGVLVQSNKVVYESAFSGLLGEGVCANVVYTIERASFEQDVVITGRLDPGAYGFPQETTRIQIYTEFYEAPRPDRIRRPLYVEEREEVRRRMESPDLVDEVLGFGEFVLATGQAFASDAPPGAVGAPVAKELVTREGRTFLIESVEYSSIQQQLKSLPPCLPRRASIDKGGGKAKKLNYAAIPTAARKDTRADAAPKSGAERMARTAFAKSSGVVIDYIATVGGTLNSPVPPFKGDTTYFVSGAVVCNGAVTIEGGAVFKYKHQTVTPVGFASIKFNNTITCKTSTYRPAIFTAVDDDSVGETLNGYSGSGYQQPVRTDGYANPAVWLANLNSQNLTHFRFSYCQEAVRVEGTVASNVLAHAQLAKCIRGIVITGCGSGCSTPITVNNTLFASVFAPVTISKSGSTLVFWHCTVQNSPSVTNLVTATASGSCMFSNCLFANITANVSGPASVNGDYNGFYSAPQFGSHPISSTNAPFQLSGAGNYYLASGSSFRNAGSSVGMNSSLLADLGKRTVDPPTVLSSNSYPSGVVFSPQVQGDTGNPDLGYHYPILDYLACELVASGSSAPIIVTNGAAIGLFGRFGFSLPDGGAISSEGSALAVNRLMWYPSVQEQPVLLYNIATRTGGVFNVTAATSTASNALKPVIKIRFSDLPMVGLRQTLFYQSARALNLNTVSVKDSYLRAVSLEIKTNSVQFPQIAVPVVTLWNNVLERSSVTVFNGYTNTINNPVGVTAYNNSFWESTLALTYNDNLASYHPGWTIQDNLFDNATISFGGTGSYLSFVSRSYNGFYNTPTSSQLGGSGNVTVTALSYATGPNSWPWYIGSSTPSLQNVDTSRTADTAGLYHYTILTNQTRELASYVDLGFHYVALNGSTPFDSDGDGIPDYVEDQNGNGITDGSETSFVNPTITLAASPLNYTENDPATIVDATATVSDSDSVNLSGGTLTVDFSANGQTEDLISIRNEGTGAGQISVTWPNVKYGGTTIGTLSGSLGNWPLVVTFNSAASIAAAQALVRNITYQDNSENPVTLARTLRMILTDGRSGTSSPASKTVNVTAVNDPPVLTLSGGPITYIKGSAAIILTAGGTVYDPDSPILSTGQLTVSFGTNAQSGDLLGIRHQGMGAGQVGVQVSGTTNVYYCGACVGTCAGGAGTPLVLQFNGSSSCAAAQAILCNVTYENTLVSPPDSTRNLEFIVGDGAGGFSPAAQQAVIVTCASKLDVMLVIDVSHSLDGQPFIDEKEAAKSLLSYLRYSDHPSIKLDQIGVIKFCGVNGSVYTPPAVVFPLGSDATSAKTAINGMAQCFGTQFHQPIDLAQSTLAASANSGAQRVMVLMTDGQVSPNTQQYRDLAINAAAAAKNAGTRIITVGFGTVDQALLTAMASSTRDTYTVASSANLQPVMASVASSLCRDNTPPLLSVLAQTPAPVQLDVQALSIYASKLALGPKGNFACVIGEGGFATLSVGSAGTLDLITSVSTIAGYDVVVSPDGHYAYVAAGASGLKVVDISSLNSPVVVRTVPGSFSRYLAISPGGNYVYVSRGFDWYVVDVSDPLNAHDVAGWGAYSWIGGLELSAGGTRLAVGETYDLTIYDVSNPANPVGIGGLPGTPAAALSADGTKAYVSEMPGETGFLKIYELDFSDWPNVPLLSALENYYSYQYVLSKDGTTLYLSPSSIVDVSNPSAPIGVANYFSVYSAYGDLKLSPDETTGYGIQSSGQSATVASVDLSAYTINVTEGISTGPIRLYISDRETSVAALQLTAASSDTTIIPNGNIVLGGSGNNRTVTLSSANGHWGSVVITLSLQDSAGAITRRKLNVCVKPATSFVNAGPDQTIVVPPRPTSFLPHLQPVSAGFNNPIGIDYHAASGKLIASVNYPSGTPNNFETIAADGDRSAFSTVSGLTDELKIATARNDGGGNSLGGFQAGTLFSGNGVPGKILRILPNGTAANPWVTLQDGGGTEQGLLRGGLHVDRTGVFGGHLIVVTTKGGVWRVTSSGVATRVCPQIMNAGTAVHLEGVTVVTNNSSKYGPWAGKILTGAEELGRVYAIGTDGSVSYEELGINPEDIDVIPPNENFFGVDFGSGMLWGAPAAGFRNFVGDILMVEENTGAAYRVYRQNNVFLKQRLFYSNGSYAPVKQWEHVTFAPAALGEIPYPTVTLTGSTGPGLPCPASVLWSVVSGPETATVTFADPNAAVTKAAFSEPGTYVLRLSVPNCLCNTYDDAVVVVRENQAPTVAITSPCSTSCVVGMSDVELYGLVEDPDNYPGSLQVAWSKVSGPGGIRFDGGPNNPFALAYFTTPGTYVLRLSASDSLLSSHADVELLVVKPNEAPVVYAGPDQTIEFPDRVYLPGVASDDTVPADMLTIAWSKVSGPGTVTFDNNGTVAETMATFSVPGTYVLQLTANDGELTSVPDQTTITVTTPEITEIIRDVDVVSAGVGGMRAYGTGTIDLTGVSGTVKKAYLYWHGPTELQDPQANAQVLVNGRLVSGVNIGITYHNGWGLSKLDEYGNLSVNTGHRYTNSQAYRADVTDLVAQYRNGPYVLSKFAKGEAVNVNGASLVVFFDDGNPNNNQDVVLVEANDSNWPLNFSLNYDVYALARQNDGRIVVGGLFYADSGGVGRNGIARLNSDGTPDSGFTCSIEGGAVRSLAIQPDNKIVVGGDFTTVNGQARNRIARLNANGSLDPSFTAAGANATIRSIVIQSVLVGGQTVNKILVGGEFTTFNGDARAYFVRLEPNNGAIDTGFTITVNQRVNAIALQNDGRIVIGGSFSQVGGVFLGGIARLNPGGSLDTGFIPPQFVHFDVNALAVQTDQKILIGDSLTTDNGESSSLIRLLASGARDTSFTPTVGTYDQGVNVIALLYDEEEEVDIINIGGLFQTVNGQPRPNLARLNSSGQLLNALATLTPSYGYATVNALLAQSDWKLVVGGAFTGMGNVEADYIARLQPWGAIDTSFQATEVGWFVSTPPITYAGGGSMQIHVADGQHWMITDTDPPIAKPFSDPQIFLNGLLWLSPGPMPLCGAPSTDNIQLFQGSTVPSAHFECGTVIYDGTSAHQFNAGLWDIVEAPLPANLPYVTAPLTINTEPGIMFVPNTYPDFLSIVVVLVKLPAGTIPPPVNPPVPRPTDITPILRPDQFTMYRHFGATVLNVLTNDNSPTGTLLSILSVSEPNHGKAQVSYAASGIIYEPDESYTGTDPIQFTYTAADSYGNTATTNITITFVANSPVPTVLPCGTTSLAAQLGPGDATSVTRQGGQYADYYEFTGIAGDYVNFRIYPAQGVTLNSHIYLRDPQGWMVDGSSHVDQLVNILQSSGRYIVEVTTHSAGQGGAYTVELTCGPPPRGIDVIADGIRIPNNGTVEFGFYPSKTIYIRNNEDTELSADTVLSLSSGSPFIVTPSVIGPISPKSIRSLRVNLVDLTAGHKNAVLHFSNGDPVAWQQDVNLHAFVGNSYPPGPNSGPQAIDDHAVVLINSPPTPIDVLANDDDPSGDPLKIKSFTQGSFGQVQLNTAGTLLTYRPDADTYGTDQFSYTITDSKGRRSTAYVTVEVIQRTVEITSPTDNQQPPFPINQPVPIVVSASTSFGTILRVECYTNGVKFAEREDPPYNFSFTPTASGFYTLKAVALVDNATRIESVPVTIGVNTGAGDLAPIAKIANLSDEQIVREGRFDLRGTADDPNVADQPSVKYRVEISRPENGGLTYLKALIPNNAAPDVFQNGRVLDSASFGILDLTTLENGVYVLTLRVRGGGRESSAEVSFALDTQVKIGRLTFSDQDLVINVGGMPITLVRTYDSFNTALGELGYSWSYAINDMRVSLDEVRYDTPDYDADGGTFSMRVGGGRNVTLTLPDGHRTTFTFSLVPTPPEDGTPSFSYTAKWTAPPGVHATLGTMDYNLLQYIPRQTAIPPYWEAAGPGTPIESFDFRGFILTNSDGTEYWITRENLGNHDLDPNGSIVQYVQAWGKPRVSTIRSRTGDHIEIGSGTGEFTIQHYSSGSTTPSRTVLVRKTNGRITEIFAPNSLNASGQPLPGAIPDVKYFYVGDNLTEVHRLINKDLPEGEQYSIRSYRYEQLGYPHYLTGVLDPRNPDFNMVGHSFDADGRLQATTYTANDNPAQTTYEHDLPNRREIVIDADGNRTIHEYDARGNVVRTINGMLQSNYRVFDQNNNVIAETDPLGNKRSYEYDTQGNRTKVTDPLGHVSASTYDTFGQILTMTDANQYAVDPNTPTISNTYDNITGNLLSSTDALGKQTLYTYDGKNRPDTTTDALGNKTIHTYYASGESGGMEGELKSVTVQEKRLNAQNQVIYVTLSTRSYTYDANGNQITETLNRTLPNGVPESITTTRVYDAQNRLVTTRDPLYDAAISEVDHVTGIAHNQIGKAAFTTNNAGHVTSYFYDAIGNLIQTLHPGDADTPASVTRTVFDTQNRPIWVQERCAAPNPADSGTTVGNATHTIYDSAGRVVRVEVRANVQITIDLSFNGLPFSHLANANEGTLLSTTGTVYDEAGRVGESVDARGNATAYAYDAAGRQTAITNALKEVTTFGYDNNGNRTSFTDSLNRTTDYEYDKLNRQTVTRFPLSAGQTERPTSLMDYDALGRRIAETNQDTVITRFGYDVLGRLRAVTNNYQPAGPNPFVTTYSYDEAGNLLYETNANSRITRFEYNKLGQRTRRTLPLGQYELSFYDSRGNRTIHTNFDGRITHYTYDVNNRLRKKLDPNAPGNSFPLTEFTYSIRGERLTMFDPSSTLWFNDEFPEDPPVPRPAIYSYDAYRRLQSKAFDMASYADTLNYRYDVNGNITELYTTSRSVDMKYQWDALNRLTNAINRTLPEPNNTTYSYDSVGNLQDYKYPNGVKHAYNYNAVNYLTDMSIATVAPAPPATFATFNYNPGDRPLAPSGTRKAARETINAPGNPITRSINYQFDNLYRLQTETFVTAPGAPHVDYTYDSVGNRLSRSSGVPGVLSRPLYSYDDNDRLTSDHDENNSTRTYAFDANGNTLRGEVTPAQTADDVYDYEDRLIRRTVGSRTIHIRYDGDGHRTVKAIIDTSTTPTTVITNVYVVDDRNPSGFVQVLDERTQKVSPTEYLYFWPTPAKAYAYGHDLISQTKFTAGIPSTAYYGYDGHGSVRLLTDATSTPVITDVYSYDAFGMVVEQWHAAGGPTPNNYLYCGEQYDPDLGLYYNRARYLNQNTGRFWTKDPVAGDSEDPLSLHKYLYAHADPINRIDPSGTSDYSLIGQLAVTAIRVGLFVYNAYSFVQNVKNSALYGIEAVNAFRNEDNVSGYGYSLMAAVSGAQAALNLIGLKSFAARPPNITGGPQISLGVSGGAATAGGAYWEAVKIGNPALFEWASRELIPAILEIGLKFFTGTPGQARAKVMRGQGPAGIHRIDKPSSSVPGSQWHAHKAAGEGSPAVNLDGTAKHGDNSWLTREIIEFLREHGWAL